MPVEMPVEKPPSDDRLRSAVSTHYATLRRAIRRLGVAEFEVDDVAQESFLALHRKAASIHPKAERQFLLQAAFRVVLSRQRGFSRRREDLEHAFEDFEHARPTAEEALDEQRALAILDRLLAALPLDLRMIFTLCEIEQITVAEAALILEVPVGTASSRLRRARESFAKLAARERAPQGKLASR